MATSLRLRVAWWLVPPLLVLVVINAVLSYRAALDAVNIAYDRALTGSIKSIGERTYSMAGEIIVDIPSSAFEIFEDGAQERIFHAVVGPDGEVLTGYADLPVPEVPAVSGEVVVAEVLYRDQTIRIAAMRKRLYDPLLEGRDDVVIAVAETSASRSALALQLFVDSLGRQLALVALGIVMLGIALGTAFNPLLALRREIRARTDDDLTPIPENDVPSEVRPLIHAINLHMERISRMLQFRRRFLADAAHQIRTPLAVLNTQAEYGLRQREPDEMRRTFEGLIHSIGGTRRLADQMLALSQAEAAEILADEYTGLDLRSLVRDVTAELVPLAMNKNIELSFEAADEALSMRGNASMLHEMVANLIDNAIRYTPAGGQVLVAVGAWGEDTVISVSDNGPGIPEHERENVFMRFYRILGHGDKQGSGLGLAIVREIALAHDGTVTLKSGSGPDGAVGLTVEVELRRDPRRQFRTNN